MTFIGWILCRLALFRACPPPVFTGTTRSAGAHQSQSGAKNRAPAILGAARRPLAPYRCISIILSMGIMFAFRFAMMIMEPNTISPTTRMPNASDRKLFVWSGALEM